MDNVSPSGYTSLEEINDQALLEAWSPTSKLRYLKKINGNFLSLQQMWVSNKGGQKWEEIEVVESE